MELERTTEFDVEGTPRVSLKERTIAMLAGIEDETMMERIYRFVRYIYIHKT